MTDCVALVYYSKMLDDCAAAALIKVLLCNKVKMIPSEHSYLPRQPEHPNVQYVLFIGRFCEEIVTKHLAGLRADLRHVMFCGMKPKKFDGAIVSYFSELRLRYGDDRAIYNDTSRKHGPPAELPKEPPSYEWQVLGGKATQVIDWADQRHMLCVEHSTFLRINSDVVRWINQLNTEKDSYPTYMKKWNIDKKFDTVVHILRGEITLSEFTQVTPHSPAFKIMWQSLLFHPYKL